jgi:hypothetical protein
MAWKLACKTYQAVCGEVDLLQLRVMGDKAAAVTALDCSSAQPATWFGLDLDFAPMQLVQQVGRGWAGGGGAVPPPARPLGGVWCVAPLPNLAGCLTPAGPHDQPLCATGGTGQVGGVGDAGACTGSPNPSVCLAQLPAARARAACQSNLNQPPRSRPRAPNCSTCILAFAGRSWLSPPPSACPTTCTSCARWCRWSWWSTPPWRRWCLPRQPSRICTACAA